jgi:hypothetical protein
MARNHGRIFTSIWSDEDFIGLSANAQRVYMLLLSQQNLSHCGLITLTVKRWANKAADTTVDQIEDALTELNTRRWALVDEDTEEVLVRSLMRRDEVYRQPNVLAAASADAGAITSPKLRSALLAEVERIGQIEGLTGRVTTLLTTLARTLRRTLPETPSDGFGEAPEQATGMGSVTEVTTDSPSTSPSPAPAPATVPALRADPEDPTGRLIAEHAAAYSEIPPPSALAPVKREVMRLVAENVPPDRIRAGLARMREKRLAASLLPQLVTESAQPTSTTDARVAAGLALVDKYREAEGA